MLPFAYSHIIIIILRRRWAEYEVHLREKSMHIGLWQGNLKERNHLKNLGVD